MTEQERTDLLAAVDETVYQILPGRLPLVRKIALVNVIRRAVARAVRAEHTLISMLPLWFPYCSTGCTPAGRTANCHNTLT
jgi:hypothetical protein